VLRHGQLDDDLVVLLRDDLALYLGEEVALLRVQIADLLDAAGDRGRAQDGVLAELDPLLDVLVVDLVVALDLDPKDAGPLADEEAQDDALVGAGEIHLDVVEEARVPQLADVLPERRGVEGRPDAFAEVAQDVLAGDPAVAGHLDGEDRLPGGLLRLAGR